MSLLGTRDYYKPFDHPWMFDYYSQQNQMHSERCAQGVI